MTAPATHYQACADAALREASASALTNVRDRHLRSAKAWQDLADRAVEIETNRQIRLADKAAEADPMPALATVAN
ncbi:hypothetical protein GTZ99_00905 [Novosphingobium sp. FSY-8]|uniref:Uncharacterized protein n=1 Tax=Novosphingobium ovatum TaxID=1908523 RepID=A0ABW9X9C4_9SPHN|nr:hypothetical protein [Novosphingobium ovatum]NBC35113.1 hypothetical protein [Novosphingobium ovatum]